MKFHSANMHSKAFYDAIHNSKLPVVEVDATTNFWERMPFELEDVYSLFEMQTFQKMDQINLTYDAGVWHLIKLQPDDVFPVYFLYLDDIKEHNAVTAFSEVVKLSAETLSVAVAIMVWNELSWYYHSQGNKRLSRFCADQYAYLKAYAFDSEMTEKTELFDLID